MREVKYRVTKANRKGTAKRNTLAQAMKTAENIKGEYKTVLVDPERESKVLIAGSPIRQRMIEQFGRVHPSLLAKLQ